MGVVLLVVVRSLSALRMGFGRWAAQRVASPAAKAKCRGRVGSLPHSHEGRGPSWCTECLSIMRLLGEAMAGQGQREQGGIGLR